MSIVLSSDFENGEYKITTDFKKAAEIDVFIDKYEEFYLVRLLGADLFDLFIADLNGATPQVPQTTPFTNIFEPFHTDDNSCLRISEGIKVMLIQFIYFHVVREGTYKKTTEGVVRSSSENSINLAYNGYNLIEAYNEGIKNYCEIQWFIEDNSINSSILEDNFNGIFLPFTSGI